MWKAPSRLVYYTQTTRRCTIGASFWLGATKEEYHADPALSQSALKVFMRDPQQFYRQYVARTEPRKEPTPAMEFGTAVEDLAFRNHLNAHIIPVSALHPNGNKMNAAGRTNWTDYVAQMQAEHGQSVKLLKAEEFGKPLGPGAVMQAVENLRGHATARDIIWGESLKNVRIRWRCKYTGLDCRCEIDLLHHASIIGDLKTCFDVNMDGFHRAVLQNGYYIQSFMYREALQAVADHLDEQPDSEVLEFCRPMLERIADGENILCCWIGVKNKPSHHVEVHPCSEAWYTIAEPLVRAKMFELKQCYETGRWQTLTHGSMTNLEPKKYAYNILEELCAEE